MRIICLFTALIMASFNASASIQDLIDALPPEGGEIKLPCGTYHEGVIKMRNSIAIIGSGPCTVIPSINVIKSTTQRSYWLRIENLTIDGNLDGRGYIGIDFRGSSKSIVRNVWVRNVRVGVYLAGNAYYNVFEDMAISASENCWEFGGIANSNIIRGGKCQSSGGYQQAVGLHVSNANNVQVYGTAFETLYTAIELESGALGTMITGIRVEDVDCGIKFRHGSDATTIYGVYFSNTYRDFCGHTDHIYLGF